MYDGVSFGSGKNVPASESMAKRYHGQCAIQVIQVPVATLVDRGGGEGEGGGTGGAPQSRLEGRVCASPPPPVPFCSDREQLPEQHVPVADKKTARGKVFQREREAPASAAAAPEAACWRRRMSQCSQTRQPAALQISLPTTENVKNVPLWWSPIEGEKKRLIKRKDS